MCWPSEPSSISLTALAGLMTTLGVLEVTGSLLQEMKELHQQTGSVLQLPGASSGTASPPHEPSEPAAVFVEKMLSDLRGSFTCEEHISILKCLRHACAGSFANAQLLTELQVPAAVLEIIASSHASYLAEKEHSYDSQAQAQAMSSSSSDQISTNTESFSDAQFKSLFTVAMQVLANYSSCKPPSSSSSPSSPISLTASTLWVLTGVEGFSQLLHIAVSCSSQSGLSAAFAALYNCLLVPTLGVGEEVASSRQLCCQMALSVFDLQFAEMTAQGGSSSGTNTPTTVHPNVEWFQILTMYLLKTNQMVAVLRMVKRSAEVLAATAGHSECFSVSMTHEEVIYLCALDTLLSDSEVMEDTLLRTSGFSSLLALLEYVTSLLLPNPHLTSAMYPHFVTVDEASVAVDEKYAVYLSSRTCARGEVKNEFSPPPSSSSSSGSSIDVESLYTPAASVCLSILALFATLSNSALGEQNASSSPSDVHNQMSVGEVIKQEMLKLGAMNICCSFLTGLNKIKTGENSWKSDIFICFTLSIARALMWCLHLFR